MASCRLSEWMVYQKLSGCVEWTQGHGEAGYHQVVPSIQHDTISCLT
jgi:hypothetical protein